MALVEQVYCIQIAGDFFALEDSGREYFALPEAEHLINGIYAGLQDLMRSGSEAEAQDAFVCVCNLRILPYRKH